MTISDHCSNSCSTCCTLIHFSHLYPERVVRGNAFVLVQAEDALFEDEFRLRGSHLRSAELDGYRRHSLKEPLSLDFHENLIVLLRFARVSLVDGCV